MRTTGPAFFLKWWWLGGRWAEKWVRRGGAREQHWRIRNCPPIRRTLALPKCGSEGPAAKQKTWYLSELTSRLFFNLHFKGHFVLLYQSIKIWIRPCAFINSKKSIRQMFKNLLGQLTKMYFCWQHFCIFVDNKTIYWNTQTKHQSKI